jgi:outer membrane protein TolC
MLRTALQCSARKSLCCTVLIYLAALVPAAAAEPAPKAGENDAAQLKALQEERIKVLDLLVQITLGQYRTGTADFNQLSSAQNDLCDAQLEATDEPEKRIAIITKQVDLAGDVLKMAQSRREAGTVTDAEVCRANAQYLGLKIKLLRERAAKRPAPAPAEKKP